MLTSKTVERVGWCLAISVWFLLFYLMSQPTATSRSRAYIGQVFNTLVNGGY